MRNIIAFVFLIILVVSVLSNANAGDLPCASRIIENDPNKVVCVCNATFCDTIEREIPEDGSFVTYTTSKSGSRFSKGGGRILNAENKCDQVDKVIYLKPEATYQTIIGFGGAITDATGLNWKALPDEAQQHFTNTYFSEQGIEYNMLRVAIGSSDFSRTPYTYNEFPENDTKLSNFTFTPQDTEYKIPFILAAKETAVDDVFVLGSTWSPPAWMKVVHEISKTTRLKKEYYQTYADYHCDFVKLFESAGIPIWGLTTTNEPIDGTTLIVKFQTLGWTIGDINTWLKKNFGPTMRYCVENPVKILIMDDQRFLLPLWLEGLTDPETAQYVDGVAIHSYSDPLTPGSIVAASLKSHPDKFVLATEFCADSTDKHGRHVHLGSWERAETYMTTIFDDLNNDYAGFIDWNMALDLIGGPNWAKNYVDAPIIVNATAGEFYKQPMFYVLGHFSKFIPRGSKRIHTLRYPETKKNLGRIYDYPDQKEIYDHVAFLTPRDTIVVVVANYGNAQNAVLRIENQHINVWLEADSIVTVEFPYNNCNSETDTSE